MPVNTPSKEYKAAQEWWERCRDVAAGSDAVKKKGIKYLPMLDGQTVPQYEAYVTRAFFYGATGRTLAGLIGAICRKDPTTEGVPTSVVPHLTDITLDGVSLAAFAMKALDDVLTVARGGILIDMPDQVAPGTTSTPRPYWQAYQAEQIVSWRSTVYHGDAILTRVVLAETVETADPQDAFGMKKSKQYRVLELTPSADGSTLQYSVTIHTPKADNDQEFVAGEPAIPRRKGKALERIPFVFLGPFGIGSEIYRPPILDLVDANIAHYRTSADYEHGCHFVGIPTPYTTGWDNAPNPLPLGPQTVWHISNAQGTAGMLEFSGQGLGALEKNLDRKERLMAVLGARLLETQKTGVEAADTVRLRHAGEQASLKTIANAVGLSLTDAMKWHLWWDGHADAIVDKVSVTLNQDFFAMTLTAEEVKTLMLEWQAEAISYETFFWKLSQGGWARPGTTHEDERAAITAEGNPGPLEDEPPTPAAVSM